MTTLKSDDIALALLDRAALLDVPTTAALGAAAYPIAMPDFAPPWGAADAPDRYLRVSIFDNVARWTGMRAGEKIGQGLLQVEVILPGGEGVILPRKAAQAVLDHFPRNLILRQGSARVEIGPGEPWHGSQIPAAKGSMIVCTIPWNATRV